MFSNLFNFRRASRCRSLETQRIAIKGMTCKKCERTIRKALLTKNGVKEVSIDRETGIAEISFDPSMTDIPTLNEVILRKGYAPSIPVEAAVKK